MNDIKKKLLALVDKQFVVSDADMKKYTSFRAGGKASLLVTVNNRDDLAGVLRIVSESSSRVPYMVLGNGSNVLVRDGGYHGVFIKLGGDFRSAEVADTCIKSGTAMLMSEISGLALRNSLTGFEFASGIPGSIGGAVFMNAGAYDGEMKTIIHSVTLMSPDGLSVREVAVSELELGYRHSAIQTTGDIALNVTFKLHRGDKDKISARIKELAERRNSKQPVQYPSAGSFFKRPTGYYAGTLIQEAGLKGLSVGGAQVSELHAGFIINKGGATAGDILSLMRIVQNTVYDKTGVKLEPEIRIVGEDY